MPRIKQQAVRFQKLQALLKSHGLNGNKIAPKLGCSHVTAKKKMDNPELLTLKDLDSLNRCFGVPWDDIREALVR